MFAVLFPVAPETHQNRFLRHDSNHHREFFVFGGIIAKNTDDESCCKKHAKRAKKKIWPDYTFDELKSSNLHEECRKIVVYELLKGTYDFAYCLLRKNAVRPELRNTSGLYNWLAAKLVEEIIIEYGFKSDVNVIIDKSLYGVQQKKFNQTILSRNFDRFNQFRISKSKYFIATQRLNVEFRLQILLLARFTVIIQNSTEIPHRNTIFFHKCVIKQR